MSSEKIERLHSVARAALEDILDADRLRQLGDEAGPPDGDTLEALTAHFRPYRMWVCFLLRVAAGRGLIPGVAGREGVIRRQA